MGEPVFGCIPGFPRPSDLDSPGDARLRCDFHSDRGSRFRLAALEPETTGQIRLGDEGRRILAKQRATWREFVAAVNDIMDARETS
jgi:hypothetical protein